MDVLMAATVFLKQAQDPLVPKTMGGSPQLKIFADILANPTPSDTLSTGLMATLDQKVNRMTENTAWPISSAESKNAVRNMFNAIKQFYTNLQTNKDNNTLVSSFQPVIAQWDSYKNTYYTAAFLNALAPNQTQYQFWTKLKQKLDEAISSIARLLKDAQTGVKTPELPITP